MAIPVGLEPTTPCLEGSSFNSLLTAVTYTEHRLQAIDLISFKFFTFFVDQSPKSLTDHSLQKTHIAHTYV